MAANLCPGDLATCDSTTQQAYLFIFGSVVGGVGAGVMWTTQGVFFADYAAAIAAQSGAEVAVENGKLAGFFGVVYLAFEVASKLSATLFEKGFGWPPRYFFFGFAGIAAVTVVGISSISVRSGCGPAGGGMMDKFLGALKLWPDVRIWLLAFTNLTFGFAAAYLNGYFNTNYTKASDTLGQGFIGLLAAITASVAAVGSHAFAKLSAKVGKGPVVLIGSLCFMAIPILVLVFGDGVHDWGYGLVVFYVLQGLGRAVYESTNKAVFADFFPDNTPGAFANCIMQSSVSMAICFFLSQSLSGDTLVTLVLIFGVLTWPGFVLAQKVGR